MSIKTSSQSEDRRADAIRRLRCTPDPLAVVTRLAGLCVWLAGIAWSPAPTHTTPTYDANGNLTFDGSFTYCYDAESRLTAILSAGTCASPTTTVAL